jgi:hypothetical protein
MADVTASEITRVSEVPVGMTGYDQLFLEVYIDHEFTAGEAIFAADLGVESILGVIGATGVNSSGALAGLSPHDFALHNNTRTLIGDDIAGGEECTCTPTDDKLTAESGMNGLDAVWLMLLVKTT